MADSSHSVSFSPYKLLTGDDRLEKLDLVGEDDQLILWNNVNKITYNIT